MIDTNVKFQEEYKRLDSLCKDLFSSKDGITKYINEMENSQFELRKIINSSDTIYKQLKHMRWVRNQLAHEVGAFESDLCNQEDIDWLIDFYNSIMNGTDPLAKLGKAERMKKTQEKNSINENKIYMHNSKEKISIWNKIKLKIKKWFLP